MARKFLITTAIDYTNDVIHIGHAYQKVLADCIARYKRLAYKNENVRLLTGTDEHGQKVEKAAKMANMSTKQFVDEIAKKDKIEQDSLDISYDRFIRTTDEDHKRTAANFFKRVYDKGYIYKGTYKGYYCEGCEAFKTKKDLINGHCEFHPNLEIKTLSEENYFFKWKKFEGFLKDYFRKHPKFVLPKSKYNEMVSFLEQGLDDIPISRASIKWGIPVPIDHTQILYVWFDALINYYTYGSQEGFWDDNTQIIHILGKDNLRWHALLWPAMLKAAGYRLPNTIFVNSFLSLNGQKISKSLGNVIRPTDLAERFGSDGVRYYLLKYGPLLDDTNITTEKIKKVYNSELANNLGNLISRITKLLEGVETNKVKEVRKGTDLKDSTFKHLEEFRPDLALQEIQLKLNFLNKYIQEKKPWQKSAKEKIKILKPTVSDILETAECLSPFVPKVASTITNIFNKHVIKPSKPLFPKSK